MLQIIDKSILWFRLKSKKKKIWILSGLLFHEYYLELNNYEKKILRIYLCLHVFPMEQEIFDSKWPFFIYQIIFNFTPKSFLLKEFS